MPSTMLNKEKNTSFGHSAAANLDIGDLVTWKSLSSDSELGIIKKIYSYEKEGRSVLYASVFSLNQKNYNEQEVFLLKLQLLSKCKK